MLVERERVLSPTNWFKGQDMPFEQTGLVAQPAREPCLARPMQSGLFRNQRTGSADTRRKAVMETWKNRAGDLSRLAQNTTLGGPTYAPGNVFHKGCNVCIPVAQELRWS